ncbi:hypothetical protein L6R52_35695, partial [Myxococcota bacterium]|nr:hypothetical protein [Myxococcota bacterium]
NRRVRDAADAPTGTAPMTRERARELIDGVMRLSASSSSSDDYVRNNITPEVLAHATPAEKAHMLRCLMDGPTGADDERAMAMILNSVQTPEEMRAVLEGAGGAEAVYDELESARGDVMDHLRGMGAPGAQMILTFASGLGVSSCLSDDFVRDHVDARVLAHATPEQKAHMLRCLMDGPTGDGDERAMLRVLQSVRTPEEMTRVLSAAGGASAVWDELEGKRRELVTHLRGQGAAGRETLFALASALPVEERAELARQLREGTPTADERALLDRIVRTGRDPVEIARLSGLSSDQVALVREAYAARRGDPTFVRNLTDLLLDARFSEVGSDTRTALLSQVRNYPDARSVANLNRLLQKDWFRAMSLEDQQRSCAVIAFISQHPGDRTIIDNTLDRFLAPGAPYSFDWERRGTAYGSAGDSTFHFNRRYLDAGNGRIDTGNDDTLHMVTHTVAHEVNHLVNNDRVDETHDYFMGEYRAYFVGFRAQHGRDPTRAEMLGRVRHLLTATDGAYDSIRRALADPTEGPRIVAFMQGLLGRADVTQANAATLPAHDPDHAAPRPTGDLDN